MTLDELKNHLDSDANEFGLDSMAAHGFLTASVVGKTMGDWVADFFEGNQQQVATEVVTALKSWQNDLKQQLENEQPLALPFLESENNDGEPTDADAKQTSEQAQGKTQSPDKNGALDTSLSLDVSMGSDVNAWSVGFVDAMYADSAQDWFTAIDSKDDTSEDVAMLTLPMVVLSGIDEDDDELQAIRQDDDMLLQMADSIGSNLTELYLLFHTDE